MAFNRIISRSFRLFICSYLIIKRWVLCGWNSTMVSSSLFLKFSFDIIEKSLFGDEFIQFFAFLLIVDNALFNGLFLLVFFGLFPGETKRLHEITYIARITIIFIIKYYILYFIFIEHHLMQRTLFRWIFLQWFSHPHFSLVFFIFKLCSCFRNGLIWILLCQIYNVFCLFI